MASPIATASTLTSQTPKEGRRNCRGDFTAISSSEADPLGRDLDIFIARSDGIVCSFSRAHQNGMSGEGHGLAGGWLRTPWRIAVLATREHAGRTILRGILLSTGLFPAHSGFAQVQTRDFSIPMVVLGT